MQWSLFPGLRTALPVVTNSPRVRLAWGAAAGLLTGVAILAGYAHNNSLFRGYDDAYITYRYAHNLVRGDGLVFNAGERTDSASSFLFTVVLAVFDALRFHNLAVVSTILGLACACGTAWVTCLACLERTRRPMTSLVLSVLAGYHGLISGWAVSGMETAFFAFLVTLASYRIFVRAAFGWVETALVLAVALTRYEGFLLAGIWGLLGLHRCWSGPRERLRATLAQLFVFGAGASAFVAFKWLYYGTLLPHAFELKTVTTLYASNPRALWEVWGKFAPVLLALMIAGLFTLPRRLESVAFAAFAMLSALSIVWGPFADWARYSAHMLPIATILACVPIALIIRTQPALGVICFLLLGAQSHAAFNEAKAAFRVGAYHADCREQVGRHLEQHLAPGTTVISSDIGVIAYAAPSIRFIDTVGLTSSAVLAARVRGESASPLLFAKRPTVIADTCADCTNAKRYSAYHWLVNEGYWRTPLPKQDDYFSHLRLGRLLTLCRTPDRISFGAAEFVLAPDLNHR